MPQSAVSAKVATSHGASGPHPYRPTMHVIPWAHRPPESITQTALRLVQPFLHSSWQSVDDIPRHDLSPIIASLHEGSGHHLISNGSTDSVSPKSSRFSCFCTDLCADKPFFQKIPLPTEWSEPRLIHIPWAHPRDNFDVKYVICTANGWLKQQD